MAWSDAARAAAAATRRAHAKGRNTYPAGQEPVGKGPHPKYVKPKLHPRTKGALASAARFYPSVTLAGRKK